MLILFTTNGLAQIGLKPLQSNPTIQSYLKENPNYTWNAPDKLYKTSFRDTLDLPFFEDFTTTLIYPDSSKWQDNFVFVNRDMADRPPSYGVATFDFLNDEGLPYTSIEKEQLEYGDTLTSQFINLDNKGGNPYELSDSIYLSFFYQPRGKGDLITTNDSFKLLFKDNNGNWAQMWAINGGTDYGFKQVRVAINKQQFLHETFQFQFVNFTHRWGNNNHWHLDNVYIDKNRSGDSTFYRDIAIQSKPTSLLKDFASMPYDHFMAETSQAASDVYFDIFNLYRDTANSRVRLKSLYGTTLLKETQFDADNWNVAPMDFAKRSIPGYSFSGLADTSYPLAIDRNIYVVNSGVGDDNLFQGNNHMHVQQVFTRHYAYDDGTAESGFGFNDLRADEGYIVVEFDLKKADTLRAVDFLITYNTQDNERQRFDFQIYGDIAYNGGTDELLYEKTFLVREILDGQSNRGFYTIALDSAIALPQGKFYIGWKQEREYNLTVGFDKNNGYIVDAGRTNKFIYFNIGTGWIQNDNSDLTGAPMIRPIVGSKDPFTVSTPRVPELSSYQLYPNPTYDYVNLPENTRSVMVMDMAGRKMSYSITNNTLDVMHLPSGVYSIIIETEENHLISEKLIKL